MTLIHSRQIGRVLIETFALPEDLDPRSHFHSSEVCHDIATGVIDWFCAEVRVSYGPYEASEYLGACCYKNAVDFVTARDYWHSMVKEACVKVRAEIHRQAKLSKKWLGQLSY